MSYIDSDIMMGLICRTLDHVDGRLISHGKRVAYLMLKMLEEEGVHGSVDVRDICLLSLVHDIGAYKTEEINNMIMFETGDMWDHSVYGYLFIKNLSPLSRYAPAILFHHASLEQVKACKASCNELAQLLCLADRIDIYTFVEERQGLTAYLRRAAGSRFSRQAVELFIRAEERFHILDQIRDGGYWDEAAAVLGKIPFTYEELDAYLKMLIYTIDFRSKYTVIHTITTTRISVELARRFGLEKNVVEQIRYGALLHDLGKIGIPIEILEFPGKLSPQALRVMRTHVGITEEILGGELEEEVTYIAARHHEKLDGSGYPRGLTGSQLSLPERIVAVADVVSALSGKRSYKDAFSKERIQALLKEERDEGKLGEEVVDQMLHHYDEIMEAVRVSCAPVLSVYESIGEQYKPLMAWCQSL